MKRILGSSLVLLLWAATASAQITTIKYGLTHPDDINFRRHPSNNRAYLPDDFSGSYFFVRSNPANAAGLDCGIDRDYTPVLGQVLLREDVNCLGPSSTGPTCNAGNIGAMCHLPVGQTTAANTLECGAGGNCAIAEGTSCPVEIPKTVPTSPASERSDFTAPIWSKNPAVGFELLSSGATSWGGTSSSAPADACLAENIRPDLIHGTRYLLPASRGGDGTKTYIRWDESTTTGLYRHGDDGVVCCNSVSNTFCALIGNFPEYPVLDHVTCGDPRAVHPFVQTADWIFDGKANTNFHTDPEFVVPGQAVGVCRNNRQFGCTTLAPPFPQGTNCATLGDTCDFRDPGMRSTRPPNLSSGYPNPNACANSAYVLKGTPGANCHLIERYVVDDGGVLIPADGDPGSGCDVPNFGARPRADFDCNGVADLPDKCPLLNEFNHTIDSDGDCAISAAACRGDECECGDQDLSGQVDVSDIVAINGAIFNPSLKEPLCDTNLDYLCNVSDIVGANQEIFVKGSSVCPHVTTINCGDGFPDPGEECDDGNHFSGDGCNAICRDE